MAKFIVFEKRGEIAVITLNRPDRLSAWDTPIRSSSPSGSRNANGDPAVRAVIMVYACAQFKLSK